MTTDETLNHQPAENFTIPCNESDVPAAETTDIPEDIVSEIIELSDDTEPTGQPETILQEINTGFDKLSQIIEALPDHEVFSSQIGQLQKQIEELTASVKELAENKQASDTKTDTLKELINKLIEKQDSNDRKLTQTLRENANFQIQVRNGMQHDLDDLKKRVNGEQYLPILKDISEMYVDYIFLTDCKLSETDIKKNLSMMFDQFEDFFEENGASVCISESDSPRKSRSCRVVEKIPTGDQTAHNTIAKSRKPGIIKGQTVLQPEYVDIYVYDASLDNEKNAGEEEQQS